MQGIFQKENTDKALKYGIYRHLPTYEKIIRNLVSFLSNNCFCYFPFSTACSLIIFIVIFHSKMKSNQIHQANVFQ
ncbi:hypothetical protein DW256_01610 [Ruminococcus sp. AM22-14LB]|nr:hypothetical protein DW256_01610 [Ruminococcus sp. AM22-14LB]